MFRQGRTPQDERLLSENKSAGGICDFIEKSNAFSDWIFEREITGKCTLYKSCKYEVYYSLDDEGYELQIVSDKESEKYTSIHTLIEKLKNYDHNAFHIEGFSCEKYINSLMGFLSMYENT